MQTRDAVEAMMAIMKNEELYGRSDMPVWIERTAVGSSVQALIQCLTQLDIKGELAGRVLTRMAEVLEGRHSDEEIASADVMQVRDFSGDSHDRSKLRIAQHSLFVQVGRSTARLTYKACNAVRFWPLNNRSSRASLQVDGTNELMRYLLMHIKLSPTDYAPSGLSARMLAWAKEQQHEVIYTRAPRKYNTPHFRATLTNCRRTNGVAGGPCYGWHRGGDHGPARHKGRRVRIPLH